MPILRSKSQLCFKNGKYAVDSITGKPPEVNIKNNQQLVLLTWPKPIRAQGYGILFNGVNFFFQINQSSNFTNLIWKGDIEISNKGWTVQSINSKLSHYNSFIFFYCDDPTISIGKSWDIRDETARIVYVPYDHNGYVSKRKVRVKIVVLVLVN